MKRRQYSDEEKAQALTVLEANGDDFQTTASQLGIPYHTLKCWSKGRGTHPAVLQLQKGKRGDLADRMEEIAWMLADAMPAKIDGATLVQLATSFGISVDKMRLLREQATSIDRSELSDEERASRLDALLERARTRRVRQSDQPSVH